MAASTSKHAVRRLLETAECAWPSRRHLGRAAPAGVMAPIRCAQHSSPKAEVRHLSTKAGKQPAKERYNYNTSLSFSEEPDPDHVNYRRVTASELVSRREPPTRVKMLVRDFIDDSLYNPNYGYFARNATIFSPPKDGYDFASFRDTAAFQEAVAERYEREYGRLEADGGGLGRQVWHTPTELFKPHYARSLTSALLSAYKVNHFPDQDLIIYEVGAGNGSFMVDCLTFLRDEHPEVYAKTQYRIIEISGMLSKGQRERAKKEGFGDRVKVINEDFFKWEGGGSEPCFVVALEVFDNFAHDMLRYDLNTLTPLQAVVAIDATSDFSLLYEPLTDPLLRRSLAYRRLLPTSSSTSPPISAPLLMSPLLRKAYASLPFAPNLSEPDFIPTKAVMFLERLRDRLPAHRLLVADFDELPEAVEGRNGPVVQTRYGDSMVPCETFLVKQGYFDIFFPTDFELLRDVYSLIMNSPPRLSLSASTPTPGHNFFSSHPAPASDPLDPPIAPGTGVQGFRRRAVGVYKHKEFLETFGGEKEVRQTRTKDGGNVMTGMYGNAKMMF
ncbi:hypothetical protein P7C73_g1206, partial [Tremellales sp. Uapishka_1]